MTEEIRVREAGIDDVESIVRFNVAMAEETEGKKLPPHKIEPGVRAVFGGRCQAFYLVAAAGEKVVGALMVTEEWSDWRNSFFWWIQSVYVEHDFRCQGIYRLLHEAVRQRARSSGACGCRLYVEKENRTARSVYSSLGMDVTNYRMYEEVFR